jgi:hypothetical protein
MNHCSFCIAAGVVRELGLSGPVMILGLYSVAGS